MTLTIEIPDEATADRVRAAAEARGQDMNTFAVAAMLGAAEEGAREAKESKTIPPKLHSVMEFAGVGKGRPGAVVGDVQQHIDALRDEWQGREVDAL